MSEKSYWIWHWGDYEIYHIMNVHLKRENQSHLILPLWKISTPNLSVKFIRQFTSNGGYLICHMNGDGLVNVDNVFYQKDTRVELTPGHHNVEITVANKNGLPAIYVESDVCPSNGDWSCNNFSGEFTPAGYNSHFTSPQQNPDVFPFEYQHVLPVSAEPADNGILFDFGRELFGFLNLTVPDDTQALNVFYGESREEALDTKYTYITESAVGSKQYRLKQRAFRYVYVESPCKSITASADHEYLPLDAAGNFLCDNHLFNKIFSIAQYTFHLNCREGYFDGIKRDRWVWSGDAYQSARINRYLFADKEIDQRTIIGLFGKLPITQHINTIMDYSLLWINMLHEHYFSYGDTEFLCRIFPLAQAMLSFVETRLNSDGFIEGFPEDWTFVDWTEMDRCGAICAEQMLLAEAYNAMAYMAKELDQSPDQYLFKHASLIQRINKYYWDQDKGAFIDSYLSGKRNVTRHANIFAVMYDIATPDQAQSILVNVLKNDNITKITTPYFEGYELDALAKLGDLKAVEDMLCSYWGGMIGLGATTIWEEYLPTATGIEHYAMYNGKYEKSLCHAWGAGPIYLFGKYYLGVYATSPGYNTFTVMPSLGGLKQISGTVPINGGTVQVSLSQNELTVTTTKEGGTLIWNQNSFALKKDTPLTIKL